MRAAGMSRDRLILEGLESFKYLRADQIASLYFPTVSLEYKGKKTSERMRKMHEKGWVQRMRFPNEPYIYTLDKPKYTHKLNHYLTLVDVWIAIRDMAPGQSKLTCEPEKHFESVITDLYIEYRNDFRKESAQYFVEVELDSSNTIKDKVMRYAVTLYNRQSEGYRNDRLVILHKKKISPQEVTGLDRLKFDVQFIPLGELTAKWIW